MLTNLQPLKNMPEELTETIKCRHCTFNSSFTFYSVILLLFLAFLSSLYILLFKTWHSISQMPDEEHRGYDKTYHNVL